MSPEMRAAARGPGAAADAAEPGQRAVAQHCPYCGEEDLYPSQDAPGAWECRYCTRVFTVKFLGMVVTR